MLFDPKWEQQTKADPFSLESLIAWLENQPAAAPYDFDDCKGACLYSLFLVGTGHHNGIYSRAGEAAWEAWRAFHRNNINIANTRPWTFGAALERARATLLAE